MTSTHAHSNNSKPSILQRKRGFTLAEILIATSIGSVLMSGITSSYMFIVKSSMSVSQYVEMNTQSRQGMDRFGREMRMAVDITAATASQISIEIQDDGGTRTVEYIYDATNKQLIRVEGTWTLTLIDSVETLSLKYYNLLGNETVNPLEIKKVQIEGRLSNTVLKIENTTNLVSAKFMLRNRKVST